MTLALGTKLGPYEILDPIGAGGMGEVWKARDTRLGRIVAIKKVKEQHSERFKQEARTIAALNHSNICQLHDIGEDYLVLEYVEGKPLSSPLPEKEAVRLAIQIAAALEAAHKKGIIHRDLKPANIMVTEEGSVKLLDFGLAKLYEKDTSSSQSPTADFPATQAGGVLGTVAYMSPEQAQGQPADARSDIFSFGLVLYEMLSGRKAFSGDSNFAVMTAIVKEDPPLLQASATIEKIVRRCLAKQPSARYQAISEVRTALESVSREMDAKSSSELQPSIAVLPFVNMSGDKEQEYFCDGLAEEIINALAQLRGLKVIARTSAFAFKGKQDDIRRIAEALSVNSILEGSVRKAGNRLRITAQLINAADGSHLWSERYDRDMTDVFAVQDEISQSIAEKLSVHISADNSIIKARVENFESYDLCLKGRYLLHKPTPENLERSKNCFEQALAINPNCAPAWCGLASLYITRSNMGLETMVISQAQCRKNAVKALELDSTLAEAHSVMGWAHGIDYEWEKAGSEFRRALELGPGNSEVLVYYSHFYLLQMRRFDEFIAIIKKAVRSDPISPFLQERLGYTYFVMQQWGLAIKHFQNSLELDPHHWVALLFLGLAYLFTGAPKEGISNCEAALKYSENNPRVLGYLGAVYAIVGRKEDAIRIEGELHHLASKIHISPCTYALIRLALGDVEKSFDLMDLAVEEKDALVSVLPFSPFLDPVRSHPRYHALLRKMNLEP